MKCIDLVLPGWTDPACGAGPDLSDWLCLGVGYLSLLGLALSASCLLLSCKALGQWQQPRRLAARLSPYARSALRSAWPKLVSVAGQGLLFFLLLLGIGCPCRTIPNYLDCIIFLASQHKASGEKARARSCLYLLALSVMTWSCLTSASSVSWVLSCYSVPRWVKQHLCVCTGQEPFDGQCCSGPHRLGCGAFSDQVSADICLQEEPVAL